MPGAHLSLEHLYIVRWDTITRDDFLALLETLKGIRERTKKDVVYIAIQDEKYVAPDDATTTLMKVRFPEVAALIKADYVVLCAKGLKSTLQRSFLRAAVAGGSLAGVKGVEKVFIVASLDEALAKESHNLPTSRAGVLEALEKAGAMPRI